MNKYEIYSTHIDVIINSKKYGIKYLKIDLDNLNLVINFNWHLKPERNGNFYAHTNFYKDDKRTGGSIHRMIFPEFKMIDHVNGNGLDNRKINLRETTYNKNNKNKTKRKNGTSKYKGVFSSKTSSGRIRWYSKICKNYKNIHLGCYDTQEDAAKAYNDASLKYFGKNYIKNEVND